MSETWLDLPNLFLPAYLVQGGNCRADRVHGLALLCSLGRCRFRKAEESLSVISVLRSADFALQKLSRSVTHLVAKL